MEVILALIILTVSLALYFLPTILAITRHKRNAVAIGALNFFAGWTIIGWIAVLIWALAHETPVGGQSTEEPPTADQPEQNRKGFSWKWTVIGVAGALVVLILAVAIAAAPSTENQSSSPGSSSSSAPAAPTPTPTPPPVRLSSTELYAEREANATRFDAIRKGKWIVVYGRIENIDNGNVYMDGDGFFGSVVLKDLSVEAQMELNVGQEYSATCKVGNFIITNMELELCRTAEPEPTPTSVPPTATPVPPPPPFPPTPTIEGTPVPTPTATATSIPTPTPTIATPVDLVERVRDGIVRVHAGFSAAGSGFIFDTEGTTAFVATNHHVIERGLDRVSVTVRNRDDYDALVLGWDAERDVAVLAICCSDNFTVLPWEEGLPEEGSEVVAIGYPRGGSDFQVTATIGEVAPPDDLSKLYDMIPHTAPLNPGNSGGPLFSMPKGKVLGINTSRGLENLSFYAVPLQAIQEQMAKWRSQLVVTR